MHNYILLAELKESLSRMGSDLKHGFISSLRSAWQTLNDFARAHTSSSQLQAELEKVADQIKEEEAKQQVEGDGAQWVELNVCVAFILNATSFTLQQINWRARSPGGKRNCL